MVFNLLWPSGALNKQRSGLTLAQVLPNGTKPLPGPILTYHQWVPLVCSGRQFYKKLVLTPLFTMFSKITFSKYTATSLRDQWFNKTLFLITEYIYFVIIVRKKLTKRTLALPYIIKTGLKCHSESNDGVIIYMGMSYACLTWLVTSRYHILSFIIITCENEVIRVSVCAYIIIDDMRWWCFHSVCLCVWMCLFVTMSHNILQVNTWRCVVLNVICHAQKTWIGQFHYSGHWSLRNAIFRSEN